MYSFPFKRLGVLTTNVASVACSLPVLLLLLQSTLLLYHLPQPGGPSGKYKNGVSAWFLLWLCSMICSVNLWLFSSLWPVCDFITHFPVMKLLDMPYVAVKSIVGDNCIPLQVCTHSLSFSFIIWWVCVPSHTLKTWPFPWCIKDDVSSSIFHCFDVFNGPQGEEQREKKKLNFLCLLESLLWGKNSQLHIFLFLHKYLFFSSFSLGHLLY